MADQRIYALFQDVADAERAIGALQDHGITRDHIGIVTRRAAEQEEAGRVRTEFTRLTDAGGLAQGEPETAYEARPGALPPTTLATSAAPTSTVDTVANVEAVGKEGITTTTPQDAAAGAAVGSGVGLVAGLLLGAAALAVPGVGFVLAGGALAAAFGGAAATAAAGAVAGGVAGYLRDMGMSEPAAQNYADRLHEGDYLLTVVADSSRYDDIKQLLLKYHAAGVDLNVMAAGGGVTSVPAPPPPPLLSEAPLTVSRAPGLTPDEEMAQAEVVEDARTGERATRDDIT